MKLAKNLHFPPLHHHLQLFSVRCSWATFGPWVSNHVPSAFDFSFLCVFLRWINLRTHLLKLSEVLYTVMAAQAEPVQTLNTHFRRWKWRATSNTLCTCLKPTMQHSHTSRPGVWRWKSKSSLSLFSFFTQLLLSLSVYKRVQECLWGKEKQFFPIWTTDHVFPSLWWHSFYPVFKYSYVRSERKTPHPN